MRQAKPGHMTRLKLKPKDLVVLIAPASHQARGSEWMIQKAKEVLEGWGLQVELLCSSSARHFYLAGDDGFRSNNLTKALTDPRIKAVFCTRGGYGSLRLLPGVFQPLGQQTISERFFCGFSDITSLLLSFDNRLPQILPVHAPGLASRAFLDDSSTGGNNRSRLYTVLFESDDGYEQTVEVIKSGTASGPIVGGCLSALVGLIGTPYEPDFDHRILFLEDVREKPFRIDRMLTHLILAGKLEKVRGIVFGDMHGCSDSVNDLRKVIEDVLRSYEFPVVLGFQAGHGEINSAFRFNQMANINTALSKFTLG